MYIELEVESGERDLAQKVMETTVYPRGQTKQIPGGATVTFKHEIASKGWGADTVYAFLLQFFANLSAAVVAAWLCGALKGRATKVRIERREIELDEGKITRYFEEKMTEERR